MRTRTRATLGRVVLAAPIGLALLVSACGGLDFNAQPCPDGGTSLTYENFGAPFLANFCNGCHGADAADRQGAPSRFVFDDAEQARGWRARIFARAAGENVTMPPGPDDPPLELRRRLAEWLACGAR